MKLVDLSIRFPVTVSVAVFLLALFGFIALFRIPIQLTPTIDRPLISVSTNWRGASPQEIEREIVEEQEEYLKSVEGLIRMTSESFDSSGRITLEFSVGTDIDAALLKVSNKLDQVPKYPTDADKPIIISASEQGQPIAWIVLQQLDPHGPDIGTLRNFTEDYIQPRLERVSGVAKVNIYGGREREMQVIFDPQALAARNLTIKDVVDILAAENRNISAGSFDEGKRRYIARTIGEFVQPEDVEKIVLKNINGTPIYVRDIAKVQIGYKKVTNLVREKGRNTLAINVIRISGANVLKVMEGLREAIKELNAGLLADRNLNLRQVYDETEYIYAAIDLVKNNLYVGGTLAILVLLIFLRSFSPTLIVATSIPISIVGTFLLMVLFGRNINVISLAGMAFAAGMVVDNSIVVLENIYRHYQTGEDRRKAAYKGTVEVWGAVLASTLTTIAVFLPVIYVEEEAGQLFKDIAIAISCSVFLSLMVSITVISTLSARILGGTSRETPFLKKAAALFPRPGKITQNLFGLVPMAQKFTDGVTNTVYRITGSRIKSALVVIIMTSSSIGIAWSLAPKTEYLPEGNRNLILGIMIPPPGYNMDEFTRVAETVENKLRPYWEKKNQNQDKSAFPTIKNFFFVAHEQNVFMGAVAEDPARIRELIPVLRPILSEIPGMIPIVQQTSLFARGIRQGRTIDIEITGPDLKQLINLGRQIFGQLMGILPGAQLRPIPSLDLGNPELQVWPDRDRAASVGLTASEVGLNVDAILDGIKASEVRYLGDKIDLTLMGQEKALQHTQDFSTLPINTPSGKLVTLDSLAKIGVVTGPTQINRVERQRAITVQVLPPEEMPLETAMGLITEKVVDPLRNTGQLGRLYKIKLAGTSDDLTRTREALQWNFLLALVITYLLMAALFENFLYPLVIMFSVPLATAGGFLGLFLVNLFIAYQPLDILTMLGFVILVGVVVNNAILIVHQTLNHMRDRGMEPREALREAVRIRIRPIFMSSATSIFAMLPLILFPGAGSELYRGIGSVVVGGLTVSTLFTLFLVPSLFWLVLSAWAFLARKSGKDAPGEKAGS